MSINRFWISAPVCALLFVATSAAGSIQYEISNTSTPGVEQYAYVISGFTLQANEQLQIVFPVALYGALSNASSVTNFDITLYQPDNPPGFDGDYNALALVDNPALTGPFTVDFTYIGTGTPGPQQYYLYQFSASGGSPALVASGDTVNMAPEPGTFALAGLLVAAGGVWRAVRRHPVKRPN